MKSLVYLSFCCLSILAIHSCNLAPGSYPYAELYEIEVREKDLIEAVKEFKERNPKYMVPETIPLLDGRLENKEHWYHFYFFDATKNQVIKTWVRSSGKDRTNFALVAVYDSNFTNRWKFLNKDFGKEKDKQIKEKFENDILNPVKETVK